MTLRSIRILCLIAICLTGLQAAAQEGVYMGFTGSAGASLLFNQNTYGVKWNIQGDRSFELAYQATLGYSGSARIGYNFKEQFGVEMQAGYSSAGMRYEDTDGNGVIHQKSVELNYVTIVTAFRYTSIFKKNRYKQHQKVRLALVVGPRIGILTGGALEYTVENPGLDLSFSDEQVNYPYEFPLYNEAFYTGDGGSDNRFFSKVDVGLYVQLGVDIYPKPWFFISPVVSGYLGFTDVNASEFRKHSGYGATRNGSIGASLGMGFYFNR